MKNRFFLVLCFCFLGSVGLLMIQWPSDPPHPSLSNQSGLSSPRVNPAGEPLRSPEAAKPRLASEYGRLPLSFEANRGQTDGRVKFLSRGHGYSLFLTGNEAVLALRNARVPARLNHEAAGIMKLMPPSMRAGLLSSPWAALRKEAERKLGKTSSPPAESAVLRMKLAGANPKPQVAGLDELPGKSNYFIGSDPKKWRTNVPNFAKVSYRNVYPGIDLVYYGNQGQLEYDFVIAPGADPKSIALELAGASGTSHLKLAESGDLVINTAGSEVRFHKPLVYQPTAGSTRPAAPAPFSLQSPNRNRQSVDGRYVLLAENRIGFEVANYDKTRPLVIDPVLAYSSYLGGSGADPGGTCVEIAVDSEGNAYIVSGTNSVDFPTTPDAYDTTYNGGPDPPDRWYPCGDAFVTKVNPTGTELVYSTYLGGSLCESSSGIGLAVDSHGSAYVAGSTNSTDFPTTHGAYQTTYGGDACNGNECGDAFVTKLSSDGSSLVYSTYLGGSGDDGVDDTISVDLAGSAYVAGYTNSPNFPTTPGAFQTALAGQSCQDQSGNPSPCADAFVTKLNPHGTALVYSTLLGGSAGEGTLASTVDSGGNVWVAGTTVSGDFPTTAGAYQKSFHPLGCGGPDYFWDCDDVYVTKLNAAGTGLIYSTYLGGTGGDCPVGIAGDPSGNAYITGLTSSADFPTTKGAFQPTPPSLCPAGSSEWDYSHAFVVKINPLRTGEASLIYSTYLGGTGNELGTGIGVDSFGNAYVTGQTLSSDFPTKNAFQSSNAGAADVFITMLDAQGTEILFSTYLGGTNSEDTDWVAVDSAGSAYIAGWTQSSDFPTTPGVFQPIFGGGTTDMFVAKISPSFAAEVQPPIELDGSSVFNAKRGVVPVKFTLAADGQPTCNLYPATIAFFRVGAGGSEAVNESEFTMPSDDGLNFRVAGCLYEYNLGTRSLGPGEYVVQIWIGGVKIGEASFALK
jgi:hypothetical protein